MSLPSYYSVRNFIQCVSKEITKRGEKDIEIPSESTVEKAFLVSNPYLGVTPSTMRLNAVRVIPKRQIHKSHVDEHACNVLCRIMKDRTFALAQMVKELNEMDYLELDFYDDIMEGKK